MNKVVLIPLFAVLILTLSCTQILLKMEKVEQPKLEDHQSLAKFLLSYGIDTSEILCFKDTTALNAFYRADIGIPDSRFFNREKKLVDYRTTPKDCNGKVSLFIEKSDSINIKSPVIGEHLDNYLNNVVVGKTGQKFTLEDQNYDVYIVVYWAKYLGKINKHKVFEWQELVKKANQNGEKIRMVLIDLDYQQFWGLSKNQIPKFKY